MMVTSESTALTAISMAASTGTSTREVLDARIGPRRAVSPNCARAPGRAPPASPTVPMRPSGSRTKILISSQVRFQQSAQHRQSSVPDRMAGQLEEHVLERRASPCGSRVTRMRRSARHVDHARSRGRRRAPRTSEVASGPRHRDRCRESRPRTPPARRHRSLETRRCAPGSAAGRARPARRCPRCAPCSMIATRSHSRSASSIRCVVRNTVLPRSRMPVTSVPDRAPRLRIEAGRELVEEHDLGVVDERERDEQPLLLAAGERHEPRVALLGKPELIEQPVAHPRASGRATPTGRPPRGP